MSISISVLVEGLFFIKFSSRELRSESIIIFISEEIDVSDRLPLTVLPTSEIKPLIPPPIADMTTSDSFDINACFFASSKE